MDLHFTTDLRRHLEQRLATVERLTLPLANRRAAAVVVAVVADADGRAAVVLTRRARGLNRHGGQFALPGGRLDPGESVAEAGLRELDEEVGVKLSTDDILGTLDDFVTRSGFLVTPLVAWTTERDLRPDPSEVAAVYRVPLSELGRPRALVHTEACGGEPIPALDLPTVGTYVFSPTAAMLHQFAELAVHDRHTSVVDFAQPGFAWS